MIKQCNIALSFVILFLACNRNSDPVSQKIDKILHSETFTFGYVPVTNCFDPPIRVYYSREKSDSIFFICDTLKIKAHLYDETFAKEASELIHRSYTYSDHNKTGRLYTLQSSSDKLQFFCNDRASILGFGRLFGLKPRSIDSLEERISQEKREKAERILRAKQISNKLVEQPCNYAFVEPVKQKRKTKLVIDYPVAIECQNIEKAIIKYDGTDKRDSLYAILKDSNRQTYYRIFDQWGYYGAFMVQKLKKCSVKTMPLPQGEKYITFSDKTSTYLVDMSVYKTKDGVLMFNPGKKPLFWSEYGSVDICMDGERIVEWYFEEK